jgi:hypothetical protein
MKNTSEQSPYARVPEVDDELAAWVADYCSGVISNEAFKRLSNRIRIDPAARRYLVRMRMLESALYELEPESAGLIPKASPKGKRHWRAFLMPAPAAAALLLVAFSAALLISQHLKAPGDSFATGDPVRGGVAILTSQVDAQWAQRDATPRTGASLAAGRCHLHAGLVQLEFFSGATVVLEGPVDFEIVSSMKGILHTGKLRALVPSHASGFTITSAKLEVIDRGTEFGIVVDADGATEVHVFDGMVDLARKDLQSVLPASRLHQGEALAIRHGDVVTKHEARSEEFESSESLMTKAREKKQKGHSFWKALNAELRDDPRLALYFDFAPSESQDRVLLNRAPGTRDTGNGSIVGAQWDRGRWKNKGALDFKRPGDRVKIMLTRELEQVTFMTWIRVDALDRRRSSLLASDKWQQPGSVHWQISYDGRVGLTVWDRQGSGYVSPPVIGPHDLGRWVHLAFVYDLPNRRVAHFADGECLKTFTLKRMTPIRVDRADVGNWSPAKELPPENIRCLNGRMDELAVFHVALSDEEILRIYQAGRPKF